MGFILGLNMIFTIAYNVAIYAACAYSLFIIGKKNNVSNAWLAFVPILQYYIIGSICEEYELLGLRIKNLQWVLCIIAAVQVLASVSTVFGAGIIGLIAGILMALILHKFFYLFDPSKATIYAILCLFGRLPLAIILFLVKNMYIQMSAGAYPYPFANKL